MEIKPTRCAYCFFEASNRHLAGTSKCLCQRCVSVRASGFCNTYHQEAFQEELQYAKERIANHD